MTGARVVARGEQRRAEILRAALVLFNAEGASEVSTNHIAAALEISVGNLYHHFRDKAAIVRALFEDHHRRFDDVWRPPTAHAQAAAVVVDALRRAFTIAWEYRFLYRELASLARTDPELRKQHAAAREQRRDELRAFQQALATLGVLELPESREQLAQLEDLSWMITGFWMPHVELRDGALSKRAALDGVRAVLGLYLPYATDAFARSLAHALQPGTPGG